MARELVAKGGDPPRTTEKNCREIANIIARSREIGIDGTISLASQQNESDLVWTNSAKSLKVADELWVY